MARRLLLVVLGCLAGCAVQGTRVQEAQLLEFHPGVTRYATVRERFGPPQAETVAPDGSRTVTYTYSQMQMNGWSYVPLVNRFLGGHTTQYSSVTFVFAPDSRLQQAPLFSTGEDKTGRGFIGGQRQP